MRTSLNENNMVKDLYIKTRSTPASPSFKHQDTKHTTQKNGDKYKNGGLGNEP